MPLTSFCKDKHKPSGINCYCKKCAANIAKESRIRNPAKSGICRRCGKTTNGNGMTRCNPCSKKERESARIRWKSGKPYARVADRRKNDVQFRLRYLLRARLNKAIKYCYKAGSAIDLLGCSIPELKQHLASMFSDGMNWGNHGRGPGKWHIDHIRPLSAFKLDDSASLAEACHYLNLQPLWEQENLSKGRKV